MNRAARSLVIAIAFCAWLGVTNHCALGAVTPRANADECPMHAAKRPAPEKSANAPCCKILRAILAKTTMPNARAIVDLAHVDLSFASFVSLVSAQNFHLVETLDTGPPGKTRFLILISSIRANAPPLAA